MTSEEILAIRPFTQPLSGQTVAPPGSKSITNRAMLLAALSRHAINLEGALFSRDTLIMIDCLRALGFQVEADEAACRIKVQGENGKIPVREAQLQVGNAGTAARFISAMLCLHPRGFFQVDGDEAMHERPMQGLLDALQANGAAKISYKKKPGHIPFAMEARGLQGGEIRLDAGSSSQLLSALLMVAPFAQKPVRIVLEGETVSKPFVQMTTRLMEYFGFRQLDQPDAGVFMIGEQAIPYPAEMPIRPDVFHVEPDATAASYFLALPAVVGGSLNVSLPANSVQGDTAFADVLIENGHTIKRLGAMSVVDNQAKQTFQGVDADFNAISDTFLTLAAIAPLLEGPTTIRGIGHTRQQETDRIDAMASGLIKLGQEVQTGDDWLCITPKPLQPATLDTYEDHRVAMSFAILGSYDLHGDGTPWLTLRDPMCCRKTFPKFFEVLEGLRQGG